MAAVTDGGLILRVEWEQADGVTAPELAATWCRLEIVVAGRHVTTVEDVRTSTVRRGVSTSAFPLAEWIAEHWRLLRRHLRPSTVPVSAWTWQHLSLQPWLRSHNLRGAGEALPRPDLTVVPEGSVTRLVWRAWPDGDPGTHLTSGDTDLAGGLVHEALGRFVEAVLTRLAEAGGTGTRLQQECRLLATPTPTRRLVQLLSRSWGCTRTTSTRRWRTTSSRWPRRSSPTCSWSSSTAPSPTSYAPHGPGWTPPARQRCRPTGRPSACRRTGSRPGRAARTGAAPGPPATRRRGSTGPSWVWPHPSAWP